MSFEEDFLEKQDAIYKKIESSSLEETGIIPNIPEYQGAYFMAFRHPEKVMGLAKGVSSKISRVVPSIKYDESNLHTGILFLELSESFSLDESYLGELSESATSVLGDLRKPNISFDAWLYNQNSLIARGIPDKGFVDVIEKLYKSSKKRGLEPHLTWGAHMTTNRFTEERKPEEVKDLLNAINETPVLGESVISTIDVGYFTITPEGFNYNTYEEFTLN